MNRLFLTSVLSLCTLFSFGQVSTENPYEKNATHKANGKRKNGIYLSIAAGFNSHLGSATLTETRNLSPFTSVTNEYDLSGFPGGDVAFNFEIDFGTHASIYIEPQVSIDNASFIDNNGDEHIITTATTQAKMLFGYDFGRMRQFTFRGGVGMMGYAIPLIDQDLNQEPGVDDISIVPSMYLGIEANPTQWLIFGLEHRRLLEFPNEMTINYNTIGEINSFNYQMSNFRFYMKLRLMLIRYR